MSGPKPRPSGLRFSESAHRYWLDGKPVPGVTTIIGKGIPKPALPYWAAKSVAEYVVQNPDGVRALWEMGEAPAIAALKAVPWQKRDEAAVRGTDVHALAEQIINGAEVEVPDHLLAHVEGYAHWLDEWAVEPIITEQPVGHRALWYAGTLDAVVRFGRGPWAEQTALLDWKTSSGVYGETALQTAAYAGAEFYGLAGQEQPLPQIDHIGVVHITAQGSALYDLGDHAEAFRVFQHVHYLASRTDWLKNLVGDPMEMEQTA
ncbi:hypothetical protein EDD28_2428 [Salana multivorans]|uniref:PD-(D/E)XK nuclease superfamily protein n=1 Tax=Salana multivorans TaxID=120377 RepID=A0A3N2DDF6_9MICO|nr:hypothetical protein [Salana multivorans]ROR97819.1 hypothetical protein EDD28_2428 [Salana multivorans]